MKSLRGYLAIVKTSFMTGLSYRLHFLFTFITGIFYTIVIYFLWKSIYAANQSLQGMTFNQAFLYVAFAGAINVLFRYWTDWQISHEIIDGQIASFLIKPIDYELRMFSESLGYVLSNFVLTTAPTVFIVVVILQIPVQVGWNLVFFLLSVPMAYVLSFLLDYMVGLTSFYTESIWGLVTSKDVIVMVLSGALIPVQFFPEWLQKIVLYLPFQAIYNVPLTMLTDTTLGVADYLPMMAVQVFWIAALYTISRLFWSQAVKAVTVNGG
jgi:ABC-2 type transport system permease protein